MIAEACVIVGGSSVDYIYGRPASGYVHGQPHAIGGCHGPDFAHLAGRCSAEIGGCQLGESTEGRVKSLGATLREPQGERKLQRYGCGMAPICCMKDIMSKYWRLSLILSPSNSNTQAAGVVWRLPEGGSAPPGPSSGPVCVPSQVSSSTAVLPLATAFVTVPLTSGIAFRQPLSAGRISASPRSRRPVPTSL